MSNVINLDDYRDETYVIFELEEGEALGVSVSILEGLSNGDIVLENVDQPQALLKALAGHCLETIEE